MREHEGFPPQLVHVEGVLQAVQTLSFVGLQRPERGRVFQLCESTTRIWRERGSLDPLGESEGL